MNYNRTTPNNVQLLSPDGLADNCRDCGHATHVIQTIFNVCSRCFTDPNNKSVPTIHSRVSYGGISVRQTSLFNPLPVSCELLPDSKNDGKNTILLHYTIHRDIDNLHDVIPRVSTAEHVCYPQQSSQPVSKASSPIQSDAKGNDSDSTRPSTPSDNPEAHLEALERRHEALRTEAADMEHRLAVLHVRVEDAAGDIASFEKQMGSLGHEQQHPAAPAAPVAPKQEAAPPLPTQPQAEGENSPSSPPLRIPPPVRLLPVWLPPPMPDQMGAGMPYSPPSDPAQYYKPNPNPTPNAYPPAGPTQYYDPNAQYQQFHPPVTTNRPVDFQNFPPYPGAVPYGYFVAPPDDPFFPHPQFPGQNTINRQAAR